MSYQGGQNNNAYNPYPQSGHPGSSPFSEPPPGPQIVQPCWSPQEVPGGYTSPDPTAKSYQLASFYRARRSRLSAHRSLAYGQSSGAATTTVKSDQSHVITLLRNPIALSHDHKTASAKESALTKDKQISSTKKHYHFETADHTLESQSPGFQGQVQYLGWDLSQDANQMRRQWKYKDLWGFEEMFLHNVYHLSRYSQPYDEACNHLSQMAKGDKCMGFDNRDEYGKCKDKLLECFEDDRNLHTTVLDGILIHTKLAEEVNNHLTKGHSYAETSLLVNKTLKELAGFKTLVATFGERWEESKSSSDTLQNNHKTLLSLEQSNQQHLDEMMDHAAYPSGSGASQMRGGILLSLAMSTK